MILHHKTRKLLNFSKNLIHTSIRYFPSDISQKTWSIFLKMCRIVWMHKFTPNYINCFRINVDVRRSRCLYITIKFVFSNVLVNSQRFDKLRDLSVHIPVQSRRLWTLFYSTKQLNVHPNHGKCIDGSNQSIFSIELATKIAWINDVLLFWEHFK